MRLALSTLLAATIFGATDPALAAAVESVTITASALGGTALDPDTTPAAIQVLGSGDLSRFGSADLLRGLDQIASGVSFDEAQANPFQPNLVYRGFEASPLQGDAQGLAVYLDGVRFNQAFGDTVNWDLVPSQAIDRVTLEGANPVFGLNALAGSLSVALKTGFTFDGGDADISGGSFGRAEGAFEYGAQDGATALYVAGHAAREDGWREHSPSKLGQIYADLGWRANRAEVHLGVLAADTDLTGNGAAPVELLAARRNAVFTWPDNTRNRYLLARLSGTLQVTNGLSLQGNLYASRLDQKTLNGDASDAEPCDTPAGLLCLDNGDLVTDEMGAPIADFLDGGVYAQLNRTSTRTTAFGGTAQAAYETEISGAANRLVAGVSYDAGRTDFSAASELGALSDDRGFIGPGIVIDQIDGSIAPVRVSGDNNYIGVYATDAVSLGDALTVTLSARYNHAAIRLQDRIGTPLDGDHAYSRLNPAIGFAYKLSQALTAYGGFSTANRAPTPAELSCADETSPCSLTNFFVGDPALKQVTARTFEAGVRGHETVWGEGRLGWRAGFYRTGSDDDIQLVASDIVGRAFFRNVGQTRRQGVDASVDFESGPWLASLSYSYTDATFRTPLLLNSPDNPLADENGQIAVEPGDRIAGISPHVLKASLRWQATEALQLGGVARMAAGQFLRGDESNLNPTTGTYAVFDVSAQYRLGPHLALFGSISNLFDAHYATFGTFSPTGDVPLAEAPGATNPRSLSPGSPRRITGGLRLTL